MTAKGELDARHEISTPVLQQPNGPSAPTVLVVEDDEALRSLLKDFLSLEGYIVLEAASDSQALRLAQENLPRIILLDFALRGRSGLEVLSQLRASANTRHIPVVMLSGYAASSLTGHATQPEAFIQKPFDLDTLLEHVARLVQVAPASAPTESSSAQSPRPYESKSCTP